MKYEKIYQNLKEKLSDEEIVDSVLIPADLNSTEKEELALDMKEIRFQRLRETTEKDRLLADVMRLRFQIEHYLNQDNFVFDKTFGKYLGEYIRIIKKSKKEIAEDLAIHYTKLSRILNDKEEPNVEFCYRLEKHSGTIIKAKLWWQLIIKKQGYFISKDEETRKQEQEKVKNTIRA